MNDWEPNLHCVTSQKMLVQRLSLSAGHCKSACPGSRVHTLQLWQETTVLSPQEHGGDDFGSAFICTAPGEAALRAAVPTGPAKARSPCLKPASKTHAKGVCDLQFFYLNFSIKKE